MQRRSACRPCAPGASRRISCAILMTSRRPEKAAVGIAMGGVGSDIAVDAADIALVDDEIRELPHLVALSKRMMTTIKLNMTFSMTLNFIAIILAMTGTLSPVVGALFSISQDAPVSAFSVSSASLVSQS